MSAAHRPDDHAFAVVEDGEAGAGGVAGGDDVGVGFAGADGSGDGLRVALRGGEWGRLDGVRLDIEGEIKRTVGAGGMLADGGGGEGGDQDVAGIEIAEGFKDSVAVFETEDAIDRMPFECAVGEREDRYLGGVIVFRVGEDGVRGQQDGGGIGRDIKDREVGGRGIGEFEFLGSSFLRDPEGGVLDAGRAFAGGLSGEGGGDFAELDQVAAGGTDAGALGARGSGNKRGRRRRLSGPCRGAQEGEDRPNKTE